MKLFDYVIRKPRKCPYCGGDVYDVLYGEPCCDEWEYFERFGKHVVFGGCCLSADGNADYACTQCGHQFLRLSFPSNAKQLAREELLKVNSEIFCDAEYRGLYRKQMVFEPVVKSGICWDGLIGVFVSEEGKVRVRTDVNVFKIFARLEQFKKRTYTETDYCRAARRCCLHEYEELFKGVRRYGTWNGYRVYIPVNVEKCEPPCIGLPIIFLVDKKCNVIIEQADSLKILNECVKK